MYTDATTLADMDAVATTLVLSTKTKKVPQVLPPGNMPIRGKGKLSCCVAASSVLQLHPKHVCISFENSHYPGARDHGELISLKALISADTEIQT